MSYSRVALFGLVLAVSGCDVETSDTPCGSDCQSPTAGNGVGGSAAVAGAAALGGAGNGNLPVGGSSQAGANSTAGTHSAGSSSGGSASGGTANGGAGSNSGGSASGGSANGGSTSGGTSAGGSGQAGGGAGGSGNVVGQCKDDFWPAAQNGSVTRYDFKQGTSLPACSYVITHTGSGSDGDWDTVEGISTGDGGYFGAMNTEDYAQGAACGACVEASYNGKKVVLTIVDECPVSSNPKCTKGHIDLSRKAIRQLESNGSLEDLHNVSWRYVKCPASGNAKARLHPNQNGDWKPVVIENGLYPLKSVTLNGVNATRSGNNQGGNAWVASGQKPPYTVHATDVNNNSVSFSYNDTGLKDAGVQFMCK